MAVSDEDADISDAYVHVLIVAEGHDQMEASSVEIANAGFRQHALSQLDGLVQLFIAEELPSLVVVEFEDLAGGVDGAAGIGDGLISRGGFARGRHVAVEAKGRFYLEMEVVFSPEPIAQDRKERPRTQENCSRLEEPA